MSRASRPRRPYLKDLYPRYKTKEHYLKDLTDKWYCHPRLKHLYGKDVNGWDLKDRLRLKHRIRKNAIEWLRNHKERKKP